MRLRVTPRDASPEETGNRTPWRDLKEGVRYVFTTPVVRTLILLAFVAEMFGWSSESMMPVMAREEFKVGATGLGYLMSAAGAGATVSTVILSYIGDFGDKGRLIGVGLGGFALFLVLYAFSPWFPLSLVLIALAYGLAMVYETTLSTLLQTVVPDEMRGRVLSFQAFTWGVTGLSGFHIGAIASVLGAPVAIAIGGGVVLANALRLARRPMRFLETQAETATRE